MKVDKEIDVTGKACPMPLISLAKAMRVMSAGMLLKITGDDPIFEETVLQFCQDGGHEVLETDRTGRTVCIVLKA